MADPLREYREKRPPGASPEPAGKPPKRRRGAQRFVVQEHDATRLHWDLRLEHDGVLASWALPRFLPGTQGDNRLAVRTEDHPVEYLDFHGDIPAGQYGAGTMRIFDRGTFDVLIWEPRKVEVELHGTHLTGSWALFPIGRQGEDDRHWMIHRMGEPLDPDAEPMPATVPPMLARAGPLPAGEGWSYEVKWDGVRALCHSEPGRMSLRSRGGADITAAYPELARLSRALHEHSAIIDGEIVAFDAAADPPRPSFQALQRRMHVREERRVRRLAAEVPVTYVAFDLLWLDGRSLTQLPYGERRELLLELGLEGPHWQTPEAHEGADGGRALLAAAGELGLEGVVAKRVSAPYEPGRRSGAWVKVRRRQTADLQIGGWLEGEGGRRGRVGALLVGELGEDGALHYRGRVGSGLSEAELDELAGRLPALAREQSPFAPRAGRPPRGARWVEPVLVAQVAYSEQSDAGLLRQPVWLGLREQPPQALTLQDERTTRGRGRTATALVDGHELALTNLDKPLYPDGTTKREVIAYAAAIAPVLVPHLSGRALTLVRCPDGVDGETFFEKRAPSHHPPFVKTATVVYGRETIEHVVAGDRATLVWLAQLAALELHPSLALAAAPDRPTAVVFDLDPGAPATIFECCQVALLLRAMLAGVGLRAFPKTSGSKGLQVYVPLNRPEPTFDTTKAFAKAVAEVLAAGRPELVVARQSKTLRAGKVLVDWYQNDRAKTTIGVYSLRARPQPTVSAPVTWEEVQRAAQPGDGGPLSFTLREMPARVEAVGDLFAELLSTSQRLPATG